MAFEVENELLLVFDCCQLFEVALDAESFA